MKKYYVIRRHGFNVLEDGSPLSFACKKEAKQARDSFEKSLRKKENRPPKISLDEWCAQIRAAGKATYTVSCGPDHWKNI